MPLRHRPAGQRVWFEASSHGLREKVTAAPPSERLDRKPRNRLRLRRLKGVPFFFSWRLFHPHSAWPHAASPIRGVYCRCFLPQVRDVQYPSGNRSSQKNVRAVSNELNQSHAMSKQRKPISSNPLSTPTMKFATLSSIPLAALLLVGCGVLSEDEKRAAKAHADNLCTLASIPKDSPAASVFGGDFAQTMGGLGDVAALDKNDTHARAVAEGTRLARERGCIK